MDRRSYVNDGLLPETLSTLDPAKMKPTDLYDVYKHLTDRQAGTDEFHFKSTADSFPEPDRETGDLSSVVQEAACAYRIGHSGPTISEPPEHSIENHQAPDAVTEELGAPSPNGQDLSNESTGGPTSTSEEESSPPPPNDMTAVIIAAITAVNESISQPSNTPTVPVAAPIPTTHAINDPTGKKTVTPGTEHAITTGGKNKGHKRKAGGGSERPAKVARKDDPSSVQTTSSTIPESPSSIQTSARRSGRPRKPTTTDDVFEGKKPAKSKKRTTAKQ